MKTEKRRAKIMFALQSGPKNAQELARLSGQDLGRTRRQLRHLVTIGAVKTVTKDNDLVYAACKEERARDRRQKSVQTQFVIDLLKENQDLRARLAKYESPKKTQAHDPRQRTIFDVINNH